MIEKYLTPDQLAERWKMNVDTLRNWRSQGTGPAFVKLTDRMVRYRLEDVEQYERDREGSG